MSWWRSFAGRLHTQWWNKRRSVWINVMPWSSHALMTSSSFVEPAGLAIYWTPLWNTWFKQTLIKITIKLKSQHIHCQIFTFRLPAKCQGLWKYITIPIPHYTRIIAHILLTKRKWQPHTNIRRSWEHCTMESSLLDTHLHMKTKCTVIKLQCLWLSIRTALEQKKFSCSQEMMALYSTSITTSTSSLHIPLPEDSS